MFNLGNKAGKIRISLAALALLAGGLGVSQTSLAQKKGDNRPAVQQPPQSESLKDRLQREEDEAKNSKPGVVAGAPLPTTANENGGGAEVDGAGGAPARDGYPVINTGDGKNAPQAIPDDGYFTVNGSTGQLDEDSLGLADFRNYEMGFKTSPTPSLGVITARYNLTAVKDSLRSGPAATNLYRIRIRYRDSDATGTNARVVLSLVRANIDTGSNGGEVIPLLDSNLITFFPAGLNFNVVEGTICPNLDQKIDFGNFVYYLDVRLVRTNSGQLANFGSFQFTETETPCTPTMTPQISLRDVSQ